jgi:NAD(P)-dependent dehydrogenase (short-subunit alcohol dehydrogenase family)
MAAEPQQRPPGTESAMARRPDHGEESYRGHGRMSGKATVITGGDSGIGKAVAIAFAREGADVLISYLNEHDDANDTAELVRKEGRKAVLVAGDLTDPAHCREVIDRAVGEFGRIDVLVNNAAYQMTHETLEEVTDEEWEHTFATNIGAMFRLCKAALPHMKAGASIINTSSVNSDQPKPTLLPYATTKGAIANFTAGLAQMLGDRGIRVNAVAPGGVMTPIVNQFGFPEGASKRLMNRMISPLGMSEPEHLASLFSYMATDEARYMTGAIVSMDGGLTI